ncbi:hypothetical protein LXL04_018046 [Taraxacum kok-saghyz]
MFLPHHHPTPYTTVPSMMHLTGYFLLFKSRCSRFHLTQSYIRVHTLNFKLGLSSFTPRNPSSSHSITACISSFSPQAGARLSLQPQQSAAPPRFPKTSSTHSPIPSHPPSFIEAHLVDNFIHQTPSPVIRDRNREQLLHIANIPDHKQVSPKPFSFSTYFSHKTGREVFFDSLLHYRMY